MKSRSPKAGPARRNSSVVARVGAIRGLRVVLVEDDDDLAGFMQTALEIGGGESVRARNAAEAIEILASHAFDVALVDMQLPDENGWAVIDFLETSSNPTPWVLVTGAELSQEEIDRAGGRVLCKPFGLAELMQWTQTFAQRTGRDAQPV